MAMGLQLRTALYSRVLHQPYQFHISQNSSELISMVTEKVSLTVSAGIMHVLALLNAAMLAVGVIATLLYLEPVIALASSIILGTFYITVVFLVRRKLSDNARIISRNQPMAVKCLQEGIGGIRDVIMDGSHSVFVRSYVNAAYNVQKAQSQNQFRAEVPRPLIEMAGVILIAVLAYRLQRYGSAESSPFPMLAAFAIGAQRLLPSLQQIFFSWSMISGARAVMADVVEWLGLLVESEDDNRETDKLPFEDALELEDVSFHYPGHASRVLNHINLTIYKGQRIGLIGQTGSGKSTLVDIVMGLLRPSQGKLRVDHGEITSENAGRWRANIAHVPQSIFLSDSSLAENIAFGAAPEEVDMTRVEEAARRAQISEFIESLPDGYRTVVGERGIRLSGGQQQRIGIARALYKRAALIIFDEATSALDIETESRVMKSLSSLDSDLTILFIAHRLSTLAECNEVYQLTSNGEIETYS